MGGAYLDETKPSPPENITRIKGESDLKQNLCILQKIDSSFTNSLCKHSRTTTSFYNTQLTDLRLFLSNGLLNTLTEPSVRKSEKYDISDQTVIFSGPGEVQSSVSIMVLSCWLTNKKTT